MFATHEKHGCLPPSKRQPARSMSPNRSESAYLLQRSLGNNYLQSISQTGAYFEGLRLQRTCACGGSCGCSHQPEEDQPTLQTKLVVGSPGDVYEQEADRVADQVMRQSAPPIVVPVSRMVQRALLRKEMSPQDLVDSVAPQEEEMPETETPLELQRSGTSDPPTVPTTFEQSLQQSILRGGEVLPQDLQTFMGSRFGRDFSDVRIHRDAQADELASSVNARAFTVGNRIFFARSAYQPGSEDGQRLVAHELTHVLQQGATNQAALSRIQRQPAGGHPCPQYNGYNSSINVQTYNCAGLALRNYRFISPASTVVNTLVTTYPMGGSSGCGTPCGPNKIKVWLWEYDLHFEDDQGTQLSPPNPDFHIVAGVTDQNSNDPTNVYSKNGRRPVEGPGTGPGFRPPARARTLSNDASAQPVTARGHPVFSVRNNFTDSCFCAECAPVP